MITESSPKDFIRDVLPLKLRVLAQGRSVQIISDFDDTQSSTYVFSRKWDTHVPKIKVDLSQEAQRLVNPMCLATARTSSEAVSWVIWNKLSRAPMPLVVENGAVLVWPSDRVTQPAEVEILASSEQTKIMRQIQEELKAGLIGKLKIPTGHEVVLRPNRIATVEIRAQDINTKVGTPDDYVPLTEQLQSLFPETLSQIEIISSGSSLGIQPVGVNKESGILAALSRSGIDISDVFLIGMGDNRNDGPLFSLVKKNKGLTIGVRPNVGNMCDFVFNGGDEISAQVLKTINSL